MSASYISQTHPSASKGRTKLVRPLIIGGGPGALKCLKEDGSEFKTGYAWAQVQKEGGLVRFQRLGAKMLTVDDNNVLQGDSFYVAESQKVAVFSIGEYKFKLENEPIAEKEKESIDVDAPAGGAGGAGPSNPDVAGGAGGAAPSNPDVAGPALTMAVVDIGSGDRYFDEYRRSLVGQSETTLIRYQFNDDVSTVEWKGEKVSIGRAGTIKTKDYLTISKEIVVFHPDGHVEVTGLAVHLNGVPVQKGVFLRKFGQDDELTVEMTQAQIDANHAFKNYAPFRISIRRFKGDVHSLPMTGKRAHPEPEDGDETQLMGMD